MPKGFVEYFGQYDQHLNQLNLKREDVKFVYDGEPDIKIFFTSNGIYTYFDQNYTRPRTQTELVARNNYLQSLKKTKGDPKLMTEYRRADKERRTTRKFDFVSFKWLNTSTHIEIQSLNEANYYRGYKIVNQDKTTEHKNHVKVFGSLLYSNVYDQIDVLFEIHPERGIKYSLVLREGANVSDYLAEYSKPLKLENGKLIIQTSFGDVIEHNPFSFFSDEKNRSIVSNFNLSEKNRVSFHLGISEINETVIIDPWIETPQIVPDWTCVWEVETDPVGNVYISAGGYTSTFINKYDPNGNFIWSISAPAGTTATIEVDDFGNVYVGDGFGAAVKKYDTFGNLIWDVDYSLSGLNESWNLSLNCDQTELVIGGTYILGIDFNPGVFVMNTSNGALISSTILSNNPYDFQQIMELKSIVSGKNNEYYGLTHEYLIRAETASFCPQGDTLQGYKSGLILSYQSNLYRNGGAPAAIKALAIHDDYVYFHRGDSLQKRDYYTGAIVSTVAIPGGVALVAGYAASLAIVDMECSGIDIDDCGNVYVGATNAVHKFDQNLVLLDSEPTNYYVYDVEVSPLNTIIACGADSNSSFAQSRIGYFQSIDFPNTCAQQVLVCCPQDFCSEDFCIQDSAYVIPLVNASPGVWSASCGNCVDSITGIFFPVVAGLGEHQISYTSNTGCTVTRIFEVNNCLKVCQSPNGNLVVSGGNGPYQWQTIQLVPIISEQQCIQCGYQWFPFVNECGDNLGAIISLCNGWATFNTGDSISAPSAALFPIQLIDNQGLSLIVNSLQDIEICPSCNLTLSVVNQTDIGCGTDSLGSATIAAQGTVQSVTYVWQPGNITGANQNNLDAGNYDVFAIDTDGCFDSLQVVINESNGPIASISSPTACLNQNTQLMNQSTVGSAPIVNWNWDLGNDGILDNFSSNPTFQFTQLGSNVLNLEVIDTNGCSDDTTITIEVIASPVINVNDAVICQNESIQLQASGSNNFFWSPSLGLSADTGSVVTASPDFTSDYIVTGIINGCVGQDTATVIVYPDATSTISANPNPASTTNSVVNFTSTNNSVQTSWFLNGELISNLNAFEYQFPPLVTNYEVILISSNSSGCIDTSVLTVVIQEDVVFYIPNTFTPNDDEVNQNFKPIFTSGFDPFNYQLQVFNRWGELIFESFNVSFGWDGNYGGNNAQEGTYTWKISFKEKSSDKKQNIVGHVNLIK